MKTSGFALFTFLVVILILILILVSACDADLDLDGSDGGSIQIIVDSEFAQVTGGLQITDTSWTDPAEKIVLTEYTFRVASTNAFITNEVLDYRSNPNSKTFIETLPPDVYNVRQEVVAVDDTNAFHTWQVTVN